MSVDDAIAYLLANARVVDEVESVPLTQVLGRVTAHGSKASIDVPAFTNSEMDGYAVSAGNLKENKKYRLKVTQRITAGGPGYPLSVGAAARIFTGAPLPPGADAVVIQENCLRRDDVVQFRGPIVAGQHVRPQGNNIAIGTEVLPSGTRIRPQEIGVAAAIGLKSLEVSRRLRVGFFSSGNELVEPGTSLEPGQIYNSNRYVLLGLIERLGCHTYDLGIVRDSFSETKKILIEAAGEVDVVITSGGVSVGEEDHIKQAVEAVGELQFWSVAVKPGKPLAFGKLGKADFLGLPGNPVSTLVTFCLFVRPFLLKRQGVSCVKPTWSLVTADFDWMESGSRREFVRARIDWSGLGPKAIIYPKQGSDVLLSTVWASGLVEIPEHRPIKAGDKVKFLSFNEVLF